MGDAVLAVVVGAFGLVVGAALGPLIGRSLPNRDVRVRPRAVIVPVTGLLFAATALRIEAPSLPAYLYFVAVCVALAVIDLAARRLPNAIVLPSYPVIAVLLTASSLWRHDFWPLAWAGIGGALLLVFFTVLATAQPASMGFGDVKLAGLIGLALGYLSWTALLVGAFAGVLLGGIAAVVLIARGRGRDATFPFGPFLIAGALLGMLV
ncbi:prepilin peptidase [Kutzneria kofuensis]|uniref:Leader peptidase (Prepilin peptidase)/N-methyltransferase n=1 Tax=Kutzneria kofuensis TaxID=103725 RepID=A0A7W9NL99_9PSEU|nr:A24 family peptidase [Kutzneria kofuensis]MBB5897457.1 leader peptidase (prepilin peptidase)/N-methyltransferase [Kutzneria kofuensis]